MTTKILNIKEEVEALMPHIDWSEEISKYDYSLFPNIVHHQLSNDPAKTNLYYRGLAAFCKTYKTQHALELGTNQGVGAIALAKYAKKVTSCDIHFTDLLDPRMRHSNITFRQVGLDGYLELDYSKYDLVFVDIDHLGKRELNLHRRLNDTYSGIAFYDDVHWPEMQKFWQHVGNEKIILDWHGTAGFGMVYYPGPARFSKKDSLDNICNVISDEMKKVDWYEELDSYNFSRIEHIRNHLSNPEYYCRHYYNSLAVFCKLFKIKRVLEIGTEFGISALAMAKYADYIETYDIDTTRLFDDKLLNHSKISFRQGNAKDVIPNIDLRKFDFIFMDISSYEAQYEQMLHQRLIDIGYEGIVWYDDALTQRLNYWWNNIQNEKVIRQDFHVAGSGLVRYKQSNPTIMRSGQAKLLADSTVTPLNWWGKFKKRFFG